MTTNVSRLRGRHKKRNVRVFSSVINFADMPTADDYQVGVLPKNVVILGATVGIKTPMDATRTADIGFSGGAELFNNVALDGAAGSVAASGLTPILVETGPILTVDTSGNLTQGEAVLNIEYIEYEQATGELTNFVS